MVADVVGINMELCDIVELFIACRQDKIMVDDYKTFIYAHGNHSDYFRKRDVYGGSGKYDPRWNSELHMFFCNHNYEPYIGFMKHFLQSRNFIRMVEYNKYALLEFVRENEGKNSYLTVPKTKINNGYFTELSNVMEINLQPFVSNLSYRQNIVHNEDYLKNQTFRLKAKKIRSNPELAHIYLSAFSEYAEFCECYRMRKTRIAMIHEELQEGMEMNLIADEYIVFNIIKFL